MIAIITGFVFSLGDIWATFLKRQRRQPLYGSMAKEKTLKGDEIAEILNREFIFLVLNYDITKHR